jgi:hypothetical protein
MYIALYKQSGWFICKGKMDHYNKFTGAISKY